MNRLRFVVRQDLPMGTQVAQCLHAWRLFQDRHPEVEQDWHTGSDTLVVLTVPDLKALLGLVQKADLLQVRYGVFREPDFGDQATAMVLEPGPMAKKLCKSLPLLGSGSKGCCPRSSTVEQVALTHRVAGSIPAEDSVSLWCSTGS